MKETWEMWFDPWVGKILWRRNLQPIPVFLPEKFHGQRILAGYSPWGRRVEHDWACTHILIYFTYSYKMVTQCPLPFIYICIYPVFSSWCWEQELCTCLTWWLTWRIRDFHIKNCWFFYPIHKDSEDKKLDQKW